MAPQIGPAEVPQPYDHEKRVLLTKSQEYRLADFLRRLEHATGGLRITGSELSRGLPTLVLQMEEEILRSAAAACGQTGKHPGTLDRRGKDLLEGEIAAIVFDAVKRSSTLESHRDMAI